MTLICLVVPFGDNGRGKIRAGAADAKKPRDPKAARRRRRSREAGRRDPKAAPVMLRREIGSNLFSQSAQLIFNRS